jgi:hypothetical protein
MITKKTLLAVDKELARMELREMFATQNNPKVFTVLRHVSQSGTSRDISVLAIINGELQNITYKVSIALGEKTRDSKGHRVIRQNGGGMDMGFNLVYNLSSALYPNLDRGGYKLKQEWI